MGKATPLISDIDVTRYQFEPGDRLLVRVANDLTEDQQYKLYKAISRFAGGDVRILIVNCLKMRMMKVMPSGNAEIIVDERVGDNYRIPQLIKGQMEVQCSVVDLQPGDLLSIQLKHYPDGKLQRKRILDWAKQWTGKDVEIRLMPWV